MNVLHFALLLIFTGLSPALSFAQDASAKVFNAESFSLENGMQIVVIPNHRAPVVTHMVWYRTGAADESAGQSGIAHFLEHLMFKGSSYTNKEGNVVTLAPGEFSYAIKSLGGQNNAFTSQDFTAYYESIASKYLDTVMRMEAGRMHSMMPPPEEVESERKVIIEERRQRTDNDPHSAFHENMNAAMYVNHPYGKPVIGWENEMAELTWDAAKSFYDLHYAPNNAILVVSGDVTGEEVYKLAQEIYGPLKPAIAKQRSWPKSPPLPSKITIEKNDPSINEPEVQIAARGPSYRQNTKEALALEVLQDIMGNGPTSRLYRALVVEQKIATGAGFSYDPMSWDDAEIWLYATPAPDKNPQDVKKALDEQMRLLISKGVTEEELRDSITRMQDSAAFARDSLTGPAMTVGNALVSGVPLDLIEYWPREIAKVTAQDILDVAKKYLDPDAKYDRPAVTGYLLPEAKAEVKAE